MRRLEDAGTAVAVLPSLFEEQIEHEELEFTRLFEYQSESFAESLTHFPEMQEYNTGPKDYLNHLEAAKQAVSIPIIGSLNGASTGGWIRYAKMIEEAGADALELNIYFVPTDPDMTAADVEQRYIDLVAEVRQSVSLPLAVKIGQNFTSLPNFAQHLVAAGADGLVLFNRYLEADIDLETLTDQARSGVEQSPRGPGPHSLDRDPPRSVAGIARRHQRHSPAARRDQAAAGRCRRDHDGQYPADEGSGSSDHDSG